MSVNKVILVGRLGRDPEVRYMSGDVPVCNFSIATDESWKDKNGEKQQRTEWHNIVLYRKLGEIAGQYLKKGQLVYIEGKIQSRKYQGKDNIERTAYDIIGSEMRMLGSKNDNSGSQHSGYSSFPEEDLHAAPSTVAEPPRKPQDTPTNSPPEPMDDIDGDIPF